MMTNRVFRIFSTLMIVTVLLSACTGTQATAQTPLRVGWSLWPSWYPLVIAQEKGFFEKNGGQIELVFYDAYKDTIPALASGMLDGGGLALGDALLNDLAEDISVVLITDASDGGDQILVSPEITSVKDLRGKRIGIVSGSYAELLVQEMLNNNGILRSEVTYVEVPAEEIPNALGKTIDAGHTFEPYASEARANGFVPLFTSADTPGLLLDVFAFRKEALAEHPQDVRAFINGFYEGLQYWKDNPEEGNAIIAKALNIDVKDISLEGIKVYSRAENLAAFIKSEETTSIYHSAIAENDFLLERGILSFPIVIDETFLDPSFLQ